jgi:hypothetical protein
MDLQGARIRLEEGVPQGASAVHHMIVANSDSQCQDERIIQLTQQLHDEFDGTALRTDLLPDPPERGQFGYAYIPLKEAAVPHRSKAFQMHGEKLEAMKKITQDWLDQGLVEFPNKKGIEWGCQAFPVPKKSASFPWRGVVDMRGLNRESRRCSYPLPSIEHLLVKQGKNQMFSVLDMVKGFHQQPMHPDSRPLTCTYTPNGVVQWKVNVMGLMNAGIQFQQMMDDVFRPVSDIADCYIDDVIVGTCEEEGQDIVEAHFRDLH